MLRPSRTLVAAAMIFGSIARGGRADVPPPEDPFVRQALEKVAPFLQRQGLFCGQRIDAAGRSSDQQICKRLRVVGNVVEIEDVDPRPEWRSLDLFYFAPSHELIVHSRPGYRHFQGPEDHATDDAVLTASSLSWYDDDSLTRAFEQGGRRRLTIEFSPDRWQLLFKAIDSAGQARTVYSATLLRQPNS